MFKITQVFPHFNCNELKTAKRKIYKYTFSNLNVKLSTQLMFLNRLLLIMNKRHMKQLRTTEK